MEDSIDSLIVLLLIGALIFMLRFYVLACLIGIICLAISLKILLDVCGDSKIGRGVSASQ